MATITKKTATKKVVTKKTTAKKRTLAGAKTIKKKELRKPVKKGNTTVFNIDGMSVAEMKAYFKPYGVYVLDPAPIRKKLGLTNKK